MKELKIRKSGIFYETFDEDASILHYLFSYKIIDDRVAFPSNSLDKVLEIIKENKINIFEIDENLEEMYSFGRLNPYNPFWGGFVHESIKNGTFKRFKNTRTEIYSLNIENEQYERLENIIKHFNAYKQK